MLLRAVLISACIGLTACGFHFRSDRDFPFSTIYVGRTQYDSLIAELRRQISRHKNVQLVDSPKEAQVSLEILSESQSKQILSLSAGGRVREFELLYSLRFRLTDQKKRDWIAPSDLQLRRDYTFDDRVQLAKESEETNLLRDMKSDAAGMLLRRIAQARAPDPQ